MRAPEGDHAGPPLQLQPAGGLTQEPILMQPEYNAARAARLNPALEAMSDVSISSAVETEDRRCTPDEVE
jgi:hypothetical protein